MAQDRLVRLRCQKTGHTYWTRRNKKRQGDPLKLKKYSPKLRKHVVYEETKKTTGKK